MSDIIYTSEIYDVDPTTIMFDKEMVEFNRLHTTEEYVSTINSIKNIGQLSPVDINDKTGLCENGRHRVRACKELGINVSCRKISNRLSREKRIEIYNVDVMSGRDLNTAQRAIQAHKFALISNDNLDNVAKRFQSNKRAINAANSIAGLRRYDILDEITKKGYWTRPDGKISKDLRSISNLLKSESEVLEDVQESAKINYEDLIKTAKGKSEFWRVKTSVAISDQELSMLIVNYLNLKYVLKVDESTGEVSED